MAYRILPLLLVASIGLYLTLTGVDFSLDDAWIHLAYAKSLKLGEGFSYNPNDFETGASSPLWVLVLAVVPWFGKPLLVSKLLCLACLLGALVCLERLLARWFPELGEPLRALLVACGGLAPLQLQSSVSGMAVSLCTLLWLAALLQISRRGRFVGVLVFLSVASRAELVVFWGLWSGISWLYERRRGVLVPALSAAASLGLWMGYCKFISGHWFPNTKYVKAAGQNLDAFAYLPKRYLFEEPVLMSVVGIGVIVLGLVKCRHPLLKPLFASWLCWVLATVLTRTLDPSVLYFQGRYFAPLGLSLVIFFAAGIATLGRGRAWVAPVVLVTLWSVPERIALIADQETDIHLLHTKPALEMRARLPAESVVLVEGAGAHRFWLPRDTWILDVIGLNHQPIAHMTSFTELSCYLARTPIDFAVLPRHMVDKFLAVYALEELMEFEEPRYHQTSPPFAQQVYVFRSHGIRPELARTCEVQ